MNLYNRYHRWRAYRRIRSMRNAINAARTDLKELNSICCTTTDPKVYVTAIRQAQTVRSQLNLMYTDIQWMMRNYRLQYPKKQNDYDNRH